MTVMLSFLLLCCAGIIQAEDWEDVGNCGVGLNCGPRCQRLCLIQHNYYRSLHNSPPLKCDPGLAKSAQNWADSNAFDGAVQRSSPTGDLVESISWKKWGWEGMATKEGAIPAAVRSWYSEIKNGYNYSTGEGRGTVTHFKSVVHSHEAHVGCGINIKPGDGTYVVARYSLEPSDKFKLDDFTPLRKVGRRNKPEPQCDLKSGEREHCGNFKSPFVTPDKCIKAGCCYDDMFLDEPGLQWHSDKASIWCFKRKERMMKSKFLSKLKTLLHPPPATPCSSTTSALPNVFGITDTAANVGASKGCGQANQIGCAGGCQPGCRPPTAAPVCVTQPGVTQPCGGGAGATPTPPVGGGGATTTPGGGTGATTEGATTAPGGGTGATTAPPAGGGSAGMTEFEKDCLNSHNEYREKHGNPPLKWSQELQKQAQEWADKLAEKNRLEHDAERQGVGENLAAFHPVDPSKMPTQCQGPKNATCVLCREMVLRWYSEGANYDYNTGQSKGGTVTGHFTQVVWKGTTELGMATATGGRNKLFAVARYKPRGNMIGLEEHIKNVPPLQ